MEMDASSLAGGALCILMLIFFRHLISSSSSGRRNLKLPPGPRPLPIIGNLHMLGTLPHRTLHTLARKYGPIMSLRLGNIPTIVVSSPAAAQLFLKTHDAIFSSRPAKVLAMEYMLYGNKGFAFAPYGPYWRNVRRMCNVELLSPARAESFGPMRREEVARLVGSIRAAAVASEVVDISAKVGVLIGDMACRMIFGCTTRDKFNLRPILDEALYLWAAFNIADYVPILEPLDLQGFTKRLKAARDSIDAVLEEILDDHERNKGSFVDTLMSMINQPISSGGSEVPYIMERTNIKAIILELLAASSDTSAAVIEWTLSELLRNPQVMARLQGELETVVGSDRMVEETDLPELNYLEMVVKESLRLYPTGPLLIPHESMEDIEIMGYFIPKKSRIIINAWALGRDEETWSRNVLEFFPERFIGNNADVKGHDFGLIPFGSGRRGCPGLHIGMTISLFVVAQLVHCFKWELPDGESPRHLDMTEKFGLAIPRAKHLLLKPVCRIQL